MFDLLGSKSLLGLDIGSSCIKAVQLKETREGYELEQFDYVEIAPSVIVEDSIADSAKLVEAIKELIKKIRIKSKNVVISLSGHSSVIIKKIMLPEMTEDVLNENIRYEAEQYVPFGIEDVNLDYQILGPAEEQGQIDVVLVAVKKDFLNGYVNAVRESGLNPVIVDVDAFALENMFELNYKVKGEEPKNIAIIDVGASKTTLTILKNGVSVFTKDSSIGSILHTESLMREFKLPYETAERLKRGESVEGVSPEDVKSVLLSANDQIIMEIRRSLDYFSDSPEMEAIDEIMTGGGGSLVYGFRDGLSERTGYHVTAANPFKNIKIPKSFDLRQLDAISSLALVAVGLSTRKIGDR
ncbi:MAG: type IV pilus assembly protein PilM [Nitrospirae bacterium]|nr:type IV pilus assembly protein PilM [Nitrospirota bacterium]MBF0536081.1 type IV pilus assembly protein PilM [Nitrospirota bacterium]MBF0617958.1 type IV pilus assembly protein PilM [Nitrospirota bacterium]